MSIFRASFTKEVQDQLKVRQDAIFNRTPQSILYLNSRNSWIRMTSSVNVNGSNELAKKYVLLGGTLNQSQATLPGGSKTDIYTLKSGTGNASQAYSTTAPGGTPHFRGIRPMPGIVSLDVKSKSAYGSLREVIVNFQCWDIRQLEDLELLYMRPGYTVLVEWGWLPYIDNNNKLQTNLPIFYDILNKSATDRTIIFKELFDKSKKSSGNYDAMYGYVKNYQWSARVDGGYDCQTTIITTGEIIESLKVNYIRPDIDTSTTGILNDQLAGAGDAAKNSSVKYNEKYSKNILAGLWFEAYNLISNLDNFTFIPGSALKKGIRVRNFSIDKTSNSEDNNTIVENNIQCYLPLDGVVDILNQYVIPKNATTGSILGISLNKNTYDDDGTDLVCVAHPLQVSADPTVCLIKSPLWSGGTIVSEAEKAASDEQLRKDIAKAQGAYTSLLLGSNFNYNAARSSRFNAFKRAFTNIDSVSIYSLVNGLLAQNNQGNLEQFLKKNLFADEDSLKFLNEISPSFNNISPTDIRIEYGITTKTKVIGTAATVVNFDTLTPNSIKILGFASSDVTNASNTIVGKSKQALTNLKFLDSLPNSFFFNNNPYTELGITKNIYVNLDYLYKLSLDFNLESTDNKEKNEINVYNYLKSLISAIQRSIGNVNNFEVHVDPVDSIARIIDINYTGPKVQGANSTYNSLYELQIQNTKSTVRTYSLQSQIFPEQSSLIAIGSQAQGGQLGIQNNTMIDFNRKITDRIIPEKKLPVVDNLHSKEGQAQLRNGLATIVNLFSTLGKEPPTDSNKKNNTNVSYSDGKNALRDIIVYFQSITSSPGKNRNLIPIKFSCEIDGIGGLVIGHMFKLPDFILPKGYRGEKGIGSQLGQAITSIGHTISNNDWITRIDALNIVLNDNNTLPAFESLDLQTVLAPAFSTNGNPSAPPPGFDTPNASNLEKYLKDNNISVKAGELNNAGEIEQGIAAIAGSVLVTIKSRYPDISLNVTAGNDIFHRDQAGFSNHEAGKAIDFTISPSTPANINKVKSVLDEFATANPLFRYLDEYSNPSVKATGKHFHISYNVFTRGA